MTLTNSQMVRLQTPAPDFALPDTTGQLVSKADFTNQPLLVIFMCNHCPYIIHLADALAAFAKEYQARGLSIVGINANDMDNYPDDSPEKMVSEVEQRQYTFPYLFDQTQEVAKAYKAACTPDFFLYDSNHVLVYRGQFDDTRPRRITSGVYEESDDNHPTGKDLRRAVDALLADKHVPTDQVPSMGCNIKWKPGNAPYYFDV